MEINADKLREVRRHLDMTQAEFAEHLGVSQRTIVNWETSGVPESKTARVNRTLRRALIDMNVIAEMAKVQPLEPTVDDWREMRRQAEEGYGPLVDDWRSPGAPSPSMRREKLLAPFTDIDLIKELEVRARKRGGRAGLWNAQRVEQYQQYVSPEWSEDPDYSDMTEEEAYELGLAAKKGDEDIGHDESPQHP